MRLRKEQVDRVSRQIVKFLKDKKLMRMRATEEQVLAKVNQVITADLLAEDKLEEDARKLMDQYRSQIDAGQVEERQMFLMIKKRQMVLSVN